MDFQELMQKIAKILGDLKILYAVTGGYAVAMWGRPRSTFDIDVIVQVYKPQIKAFRRALQNISKLSYLDEDAIEEAVKREGEFNFIHTESGIKIDFWVAGSNPISQLELERRISKTINGQRVYFISPEDLILSKLRWYKESKSNRHLEDIESILKIQKNLDYGYLRKWAKIQSTRKILESLIGDH